MSAAWRIGSDLTAAHPFPVVTTERFPGPSTSFNSPYDGRPARPLFSGGRVAEALHDAFLSLGRLPQHISDRAAVDEIMKIGGWKTESTAEYKIRATSSGQVGSTRIYGKRYSGDRGLPLPPRVQRMIEAMLSKFG